MYIKQSSSNSITFGLRALQLGEIYIINNKMEYFKNSNISFRLHFLHSLQRVQPRCFPNSGEIKG